MKQRRIDNSHGIFLMWWYWTMSLGILILSVVLSLWVRAVYLPLVVLGLYLFLTYVIRCNRKARVPSCYLIPFICSKALFLSAIIMVVINILHTHWFIKWFVDFGPINKEIPFITQLIIGPMTLLTAVWTNLKGSRLGICRDCSIRNGSAAERGFLGKFFAQEGRFQNRCLIVLATLATIGAWGYYFLSYANDALISTDKFFFVWSTVILYVISVIYAAIHYFGLWIYYCKKEENVKAHSVTMTSLRFLLVSDNFIGLKFYENDSDGQLSDNSCYDTPLKVSLSFRQEVTLFDAMRYFTTRTGLKDVDVRFLYSTLTTNADCNIFHYICYLDEEQKGEIEKKYPDLQWFTISQIADLINSKETAPLLSAEIVRIHTMAMAWKTYDENGLRKYKIKHYRPTFRVRDIKDYDIDFNDPKWLYVADNNQDCRFFRFKRWWRKYFNAMTE